MLGGRKWVCGENETKAEYMNRRDIKWSSVGLVPSRFFTIYIYKTDEWVMKIITAGPNLGHRVVSLLTNQKTKKKGQLSYGTYK